VRSSSIELTGDFEVQTRKLLPHDRKLHEKVAGSGPPGSELELARCEPFEYEGTAGGQSAKTPLVKRRANHGREVTEHGNDCLPPAGFQLEVGQICGHGMNGHASFSSQFLGLCEAHRRSVDGSDLETEAGQIDGVASLALGKTEHPPRGQMVGDGDQEVVGLGAVGETGFGKSFIPHGEDSTRARLRKVSVPASIRETLEQRSRGAEVQRCRGEREQG
jgi:hypothetical protein